MIAHREHWPAKRIGSCVGAHVLNRVLVWEHMYSRGASLSLAPRSLVVQRSGVRVSRLAARSAVASPIIGARTVERLGELLPGVQLRPGDELRRWADAGALTAMSNSGTQPAD